MSTAEGARRPTRLLDRLREALATRQYSPATQNQALCALVFLYRHVLGLELPGLDSVVRAKVPERLPVVLSRDEAFALLTRLEGAPHLVASILYGSGLLLPECLRLRIKDLDFATNQIMVRRGKGKKDRSTPMPAAARPMLREQLERVRGQFARDLKEGAGWVELPDALGRKLPTAGRGWRWQWVFPATRTYRHVESGQRRRNHLHQTVVQRAVTRAVRDSRPDEASHPPHLPTLVRHAPARVRLRHPHGAGTPRSLGCPNDDDLHPRPQPRPGRSPEPARPALRSSRVAQNTRPQNPLPQP